MKGKVGFKKWGTNILIGLILLTTALIGWICRDLEIDPALDPQISRYMHIIGLSEKIDKFNRYFLHIPACTGETRTPYSFYAQVPPVRSRKKCNELN